MREHTLSLIQDINPVDEKEVADRNDALDWMISDAPLYRIQKPDVPPKHLVSYFLVIDTASQKILLQDHLLAKLWLPAGGHVDPDEDPTETVRRECQEELGIEAVFLGEPIPHFITVTQTNGQGLHTDVSLWYVLRASEDTPLSIEPDRFAEVRWWDISKVLSSSIELFDPELHRFLKKLQSSSILKA
jgi:8-oxo-dGTP pyrophosphatase MutT (NUDIX family)